MIKLKGMEIFDKSLSLSEANMKKLQDSVQQAKDLQTTISNMNIDDNSNEDIQKMLNNLRSNMDKEIEIILQTIIIEESKKVFKK